MKDKSNNIQNLLYERGNRYGKFDGHASITQALKLVKQVCNYTVIRIGMNCAMNLTV